MDEVKPAVPVALEADDFLSRKYITKLGNGKPGVGAVRCKIDREWHVQVMAWIERVVKHHEAQKDEATPPKVEVVS